MLMVEIKRKTLMMLFWLLRSFARGGLKGLKMNSFFLGKPGFYIHGRHMVVRQPRYNPPFIDSLLMVYAWALQVADLWDQP